MELAVGQLARQADVKISTLHFYEQHGLIYARRSFGNQRRFEQSTLKRLSAIKIAQKFGMSLDEIKQALSCLPLKEEPTKKHWQEFASRWKEDLDNRIELMIEMRNELSSFTSK